MDKHNFFDEPVLNIFSTYADVFVVCLLYFRMLDEISSAYPNFIVEIVSFFYSTVY